jgi:hypothetical protein
VQTHRTHSAGRLRLPADVNIDFSFRPFLNLTHESFVGYCHCKRLFLLIFVGFASDVLEVLKYEAESIGYQAILSYNSDNAFILCDFNSDTKLLGVLLEYPLISCLLVEGSLSEQ